MNVLVTGASGFVGSALVDRLSAKGHNVVCQSRRAHSACTDVAWIQHDLTADPTGALSLPPIDFVYHLAGQTSTYVAQRDPLGDLEANVVGFLKLLSYFRIHGDNPFVVLAGTATEVGLTTELPIHEGLCNHPITFYDISKLTAEMYLMQYVREGRLRGCVLRLANVYGHRRSEGEADRGILDKVFSRALSGDSVTIYGDGAALRDYVFIDDVVSAFTLAPEHPMETNGRVFLIGTGVGTSLSDAFRKVGAIASSITGKPVEYSHVDPPSSLSEIEFRNAVIDSSAFRRATGWIPKYDFDAGLRAAYQSSLTPFVPHHG